MCTCMMSMFVYVSVDPSMWRSDNISAYLILGTQQLQMPLAFMWILGGGTQVLVPVWQVLHLLNHPPSSET